MIKVKIRKSEMGYAKRTWTDFCRKQLQEKIGVKVHFLLDWVSTHRPIFYHR